MVDPKKIREEVEPVTAEVLERRGRLWTVRYLCAPRGHSSEMGSGGGTEDQRRVGLLRQLITRLLSPLKPVSDESTVEWLWCLMAGERTPQQFCNEVRRYDNGQRCGMVWTADFVAYRCRTCSISPCMSLCADCFEQGRHSGHDYNMFRSLAGGACDCGDSFVMKESGFCTLHGLCGSKSDQIPPDFLMKFSRILMPYIFERLLIFLRANCFAMETLEAVITKADGYLLFLKDLCNMRAVMRSCITQVLTDPKIYREMESFQSLDSSSSDPVNKYLRDSYQNYRHSIRNMPKFTYNNFSVHMSAEEVRYHEEILNEVPVHTTMLDELVFWTYKYEFPTKLVCLLLFLLPDQYYKNCFTRAFVRHYAPISHMLASSQDTDPLTNRVVHVSVQLFSNKNLAIEMTEQLHLLHRMIVSLHHMTASILVPSQIHNSTTNTHTVADCSSKVMQKHCYWPLVSDLSNLLGHQQVAFYFVNNDHLLNVWFSYLSMYQGMNVNIRQVVDHIDIEPSTYYASFSAELEGVAAPIWAILTHLKESPASASLTQPAPYELNRRLLHYTYVYLERWHEAVKAPTTYREMLTDASMDLKCSFHLPLHRYVSLVISESLRRSRCMLPELMPPQHLLFPLAYHILHLQAKFSEISCGMWVRNGNQMRGQTMTYTQSNFCCSMIDADIFLLQLCCSRLDPDMFIRLVFTKFFVWNWLSYGSYGLETGDSMVFEHERPMLEACLTLITSILCIRTCTGLCDEDVSSIEIASLLCMNDRTHSQLYDVLPEKCEALNSTELFETVLKRVSVFKDPAAEASGSMQQGTYSPHVRVWHELYDPVYVQLRSMTRRNLQTSIDRFTAHVRATGTYTDQRKSPWPPYRVPILAECSLPQLLCLVHSRSLHALLLVTLHRCLTAASLGEHLLSLAVFLLEMCVRLHQPSLAPSTAACEGGGGDACDTQHTNSLLQQFRDGDIVGNVCTLVDTITVPLDRGASCEARHEGLAAASATDCAVRSDTAMDSSCELATTSSVQCVAMTSHSAHSDVTHSSGTEGAQHTATHRDVTVEPSATTGTQSFPRASTSPALTRVPPVLLSTSTRVPPLASHPHSRTVTVGESVVSLLLKLYGRLASDGGGRDSQDTVFQLPSDEKLEDYTESRVGNGQHFIGQLLIFMAKKDPALKSCIRENISRIWPHSSIPISDDSRCADESKELRKKQCQRRQQKLMQQFASKQQQFYKYMIDEQMEVDTDNVIGATSSQSYDCVICGQHNSPATSSLEGASADSRDCTQHSTQNMFGLVVFLQSTSVLSHQREHTVTPSSLLPLLDAVCQTEPEGAGCTVSESSAACTAARNTRRAHISEITASASVFDNCVQLTAPLQSFVLDGLHVQTCGHHLHLDCYRMYMQSLTSLVQQNINVQRGEFSCPLCRQLCNSVFPLCPLTCQSDSPPPLSADPSSSTVSSPLPSQSASASHSASSIEDTVMFPASVDVFHIAQMISHVCITPPKFEKRVLEVIALAVDAMKSNASHLMHSVSSPESTLAHLGEMMFVLSVARANLEIELVQRGGDLLETHTTARQLVPSVKRSCFPPLLSLLSVQARAFAAANRHHVTGVWAQLCGVRDPTCGFFVDPNVRIPVCQDHVLSAFTDTFQPAMLSCSTRPSSVPIPLIAHDTCSLLISHVMYLSQVCLREPVYTCLVQRLLWHCLVQCTVRFLCGHRQTALSAQQLQNILQAWLADTCSTQNDLLQISCAVISSLIRLYDESPITFPHSPLPPHPSPLPNFHSIASFSQHLRVSSLHFLRIASILKHHLFPTATLPSIPAVSSHCSHGTVEFTQLCDYLRVTCVLDTGHTQIADRHLPQPPSLSSPYPPLDTGLSSSSKFSTHIVDNWLRFLLDYRAHSHVIGAFVDCIQRPLWSQPKLLQLPHEYKTIFLYYHNRRCAVCHTVPKDPSVCLVCGTLVCMRDVCCKRQEVCEAVLHSRECGSGTCILLTVKSTSVVIIRDKRACVWGSVYLDSFGEEDRDLKRGKPLHLSTERYQLLENIWLSHSFDNARRRWVWHRDNL